MVNERARYILRDLEQTLLQFVQKHKITHNEYRCATEILVGSVKAGEESLLYDVFIEAAATDADNTGNRGSLRAPTKRGQSCFSAVALFHQTARWWPARNWTCGTPMPKDFIRTFIPVFPNGICAVVFGPQTMDHLRSGPLFPRRTRFRRMARPESSLGPLAGISFGRLTCM